MTESQYFGKDVSNHRKVPIYTCKQKKCEQKC